MISRMFALNVGFIFAFTVAPLALPFFEKAAQAHTNQAHGDLPGETRVLVHQSETIKVENFWARPSQGPNGAVYMTLSVLSGKPDKLIRAESPVCSSVELHTHIQEGNVKKMRPVESIEIQAHQKTTLEPGGMHIMLMGLKHPLTEGASVELTLHFENAAPLMLAVPVRAQTFAKSAIPPAQTQKHVCNCPKNS